MTGGEGAKAGRNAVGRRRCLGQSLHDPARSLHLRHRLCGELDRRPFTGDGDHLGRRDASRVKDDASGTAALAPGQMLVPPSMLTTLPVIKAACGLSKNSTRAATSSRWPKRPAGMRPSSSSLVAVSSRYGLVIRVGK